MSVIRKKPFIESVIESLTDEQKASLLSVMNGSENTVNASFTDLPEADVAPVLFQLEPNNLKTGILIQGSTYDVLLAYHRFQDMQIYKLDLSKFTYEKINEYLDINELRRTVSGGSGGGSSDDEIVLDLSSINIVDTSEATHQRIYITDENILEQLTPLKKYVNNPDIIKPVQLKLKDASDNILALKCTFKYNDVDTGNSFTISATNDTYILNIDIVFRPRYDDWYLDSTSVSYWYLNMSYIINSLISTQTLNISANQYNAYISIQINNWEIYYETNKKDKANIESYVDAWKISMCGAVDYAITALGLSLPTTTMENIDSNLKSVLDTVSIAQQEAVGALLLLVGAGVPNDLICASMQDNTTGLVYYLIPTGTLDGQQVYTLGSNGATNASDILKDVITSDNEVSVSIGYN